MSIPTVARNPIQDFTGDEIAELLKIPTREPDNSVSFVSSIPGNDQIISSAWTEPEPLGSDLPPVPAFDPELLPDALRPWCIDVADRMQVPLDFPAVAAVATMGASVMRRAEIQPKVNDASWTEYPNIWGAIVGPPGMMKSPVVDAATAPLRKVNPSGAQSTRVNWLNPKSLR